MFDFKEDYNQGSVPPSLFFSTSAASSYHQAKENENLFFSVLLYLLFTVLALLWKHSVHKVQRNNVL